MIRILVSTALVALLLPVAAAAQTWTSVTLPDGPSEFVPKLLDIALDDGVAWFSTEFDGIMGYDGDQWVVHSVENSGLRSNAYRFVMFVDAVGDKWTAKDGSATVDRLDDGGTFSNRDDDEWTYYSQPAQLNSRRVFSMTEDSLGNKWFGIRDENAVETSVIELLIENGEGTADDVWRAFGGEFEPDIFEDGDVRGLEIDSEDRLWIIYANNGVDVWDYGDYESFDDDEITHYGITDGLPSNTVRAAAMAPDGRVWLGTDGGLAVLDSWGGPWVTIESMLGMRVFDVASDPQGHVWAATDQGVVMLYASGEIAMAYGTADGLDNENISLIAVDQNDGTVWAVSVNEETETQLNVLESGFGTEPRVFAYPNPWIQGQTLERGIKLLGAPEGSVVEVLDITGQLVRKLPSSPEPIEWNSLDESGNEVGSGVYILRVEKPGGEVVFAKVAIVR